MPMFAAYPLWLRLSGTVKHGVSSAQQANLKAITAALSRFARIGSVAHAAVWGG